ncbi:MAG: NUDIX hydrolase [Bacteroidota bacterium]|nr:NUDIX hydrolase [Bacteroidota bacterium]
MKVDIREEEIILKDFFTIYRSKMRFEHFDGTMSDVVNRLSLEKDEAIAVLVYHVTRDEYILVRQFRYPLCHHDIDPWITEIVAGGIQPGEELEKAAARELEEEIGFVPLRLERITTCYVSPGIMNEKVTIFIAEVDDSSKINNGGGADEEDEDIELVWIPSKEANEWMSSQKVGDAKTIIAMQWHLSREITYNEKRRD